MKCRYGNCRLTLRRYQQSAPGVRWFQCGLFSQPIICIWVSKNRTDGNGMKGFSPSQPRIISSPVLSVLQYRYKSLVIFHHVSKHQEWRNQDWLSWTHEARRSWDAAGQNVEWCPCALSYCYKMTLGALKRTEYCDKDTLFFPFSLSPALLSPCSRAL